VGVAWVRGAPKNLGMPFNISATAEASDFKFGTSLGFAKTHNKTTPRGKSGRGLGLWELPKILGFLYNIPATAEASNFKFGTLWGLPRPIVKSHTEEKVDVAVCYRTFQNFRVPFNICATAEASNFRFGMQLGCQGPP